MTGTRGTVATAASGEPPEPGRGPWSAMHEGQITAVRQRCQELLDAVRQDESRSGRTRSLAGGAGCWFHVEFAQEMRQVIIGFLVSSMLPSTTFPGPVAACACVLVVIGVVAWLTPGFPRGLFFSVAVQPWLRSTPEGSHVLWWYRMKVTLHTLIGVALVVLAWPTAGTPVPWFVAMLAGLGWQLGGCSFAYQAARRQVLPHGIDPAAAQEAE